MKKLLLIITIVISVSGLLAFPYFPMTNVMEVTVNDGQDLQFLNMGLNRLYESFDED